MTSLSLSSSPSSSGSLPVRFPILLSILISIITSVTLATDATGAPKTSKTSKISKIPWTALARRVGQSEEGRARAIALLKQEKNLESLLLNALETRDRHLALDVIGSLEMKTLAPELMNRVAADRDGFLTLALNSLMDEKNSPSILRSHIKNLNADRQAKLSPAAIVAMLEPLGRLGTKIPKRDLTALSTHSFPEVRSAVLYYLRAMALQHRNREYDSLILQALNATEFQIRLQAVSLLTELARSGITIRSSASALTTVTGATFAAESLNRDKLVNHCLSERHPKIRENCLSIARGRLDFVSGEISP